MKNNSKPPQVDPYNHSLEDLYTWGRWVAKRGNITLEKSKKILERVRKMGYVDMV